jgi:hypothetical protein
MRRRLIKGSFLLASSILIFVQILSGALPAHSVEFGQDATGDPNAVKVGGGSGFLYSERIVLTVGHVIGGTGGIEYWERNGVIHTPGIVTLDGAKQYKVKKVLILDTYLAPDYAKPIQAVDDLAVIILSEDIPMTKKAVLATEEQMKRFVKEKSKVELVGYGIRNSSERILAGGRNNRPPTKLTSTLISPEEVTQFYKQYPNGIPSAYKVQAGNYGIVQHRELGKSQLCDGDSGSAFFVEEDNVRYVLGMTGQGLINNVCPPPETWFGAPSMSWVNPAFKLSDLIKTAEKIVDEDRKREFAAAEVVRLAAELKAKQEAEVKAAADLKAKQDADTRTALELKAKEEADAKAVADRLAAEKLAATKAAALKKTTITCIKGKLVKKVMAVKPLCPAGYKKK